MKRLACAALAVVIDSSLARSSYTGGGRSSLSTAGILAAIVTPIAVMSIFLLVLFLCLLKQRLQRRRRCISPTSMVTLRTREDGATTSNSYNQTVLDNLPPPYDDPPPYSLYSTTVKTPTVIESTRDTI